MIFAVRSSIARTQTQNSKRSADRTLFPLGHTLQPSVCIPCTTSERMRLTSTFGHSITARYADIVTTEIRARSHSTLLYCSSLDYRESPWSMSQNPGPARSLAQGGTNSNRLTQDRAFRGSLVVWFLFLFLSVFAALRCAFYNHRSR